MLRKLQLHRYTDVSCRRHDRIALPDVRCVVTAGLDGGASLRLLCLLLDTMELFCLSFPLCNCVRVLRKPQFHRDTIHGDVSCRRRDHIALADVRCVVTAGLDGGASLRAAVFFLRPWN